MDFWFGVLLFSLLAMQSHMVYGNDDEISPLSHEIPEVEPNEESDHEAFLGKDEAEQFKELTPEQSKDKLRELFPKVDGQTTLDGKVTSEELVKWMAAVQQKFVRSDSDSLFKSNDQNLDGGITWDEYHKHTYLDDKARPEGEDGETRKVQLTRDGVRFRRADTNGDSTLNKDEFHAFHQPELYEHMKGVVVEETLHEVDKNKDGFISEDEYVDDLVRGSEEGSPRPDWVSKYQKRFAEVYDKNKDGKLNEEEIKGWIFPDPEDHLRKEAQHLFSHSDSDKDGVLTVKEMLDAWDVFVGSENQTTFSDIFNSVERHDEL